MTGARRKFEKLDRRAQARLDALVVEHAERQDKPSFHVVVEQMAKAGIVVAFQHVDSSCDRLNYKWGEVFAPATRAERGHPDAKQPTAVEPAAGSVEEQLRAIRAAIAGLSSAIGELRLSQHAMQQHITTERQLAKDRAASIRADMQTLLSRTTNAEIKLDNITRILSAVHVRQKFLPGPVGTAEQKREEIE